MIQQNIDTMLESSDAKLAPAYSAFRRCFRIAELPSHAGELVMMDRLTDITQESWDKNMIYQDFTHERIAGILQDPYFVVDQSNAGKLNPQEYKGSIIIARGFQLEWYIKRDIERRIRRYDGNIDITLSDSMLGSTRDIDVQSNKKATVREFNLLLGNDEVRKFLQARYEKGTEIYNYLHRLVEHAR